MSAVIETPVSSVPTLTGNFNGQTLKLRQITVEEYDQMIGNGVFDENDRVELLNGAIVEKIPKGKNTQRQPTALPNFLTETSVNLFLSEIRILYGSTNFPNLNRISF